MVAVVCLPQSGPPRACPGAPSLISTVARRYAEESGRDPFSPAVPLGLFSLRLSTLRTGSVQRSPYLRLGEELLQLGTESRRDSFLGVTGRVDRAAAEIVFALQVRGGQLFTRGV